MMRFSCLHSDTTSTITSQPVLGPISKCWTMRHTKKDSHIHNRELGKQMKKMEVESFHKACQLKSHKASYSLWMSNKLLYLESTAEFCSLWIILLISCQECCMERLGKHVKENKEFYHDCLRLVKLNLFKRLIISDVKTIDEVKILK